MGGNVQRQVCGKGLDLRIDHRSYERQGVDLLPTIHEGATVRAMEKKGIRTEKGEFNRWIKATNAVIKDIRKKISLLFDWINGDKRACQAADTRPCFSAERLLHPAKSLGIFAKRQNQQSEKEMNETYNYLRANGIYTLEDLESRLQSHRTTVDSLKTTMDSQNARMKAIRRDIPLTLADERIARAIRENNAKLVIIDPATGVFRSRCGYEQSK